MDFYNLLERESVASRRRSPGPTARDLVWAHILPKDDVYIGPSE